MSSFEDSLAGLAVRIDAQGQSVRDLKASKAPKEEIDGAIAELLRLKEEFVI